MMETKKKKQSRQHPSYSVKQFHKAVLLLQIRHAHEIHVENKTEQRENEGNEGSRGERTNAKESNRVA